MKLARRGLTPGPREIVDLLTKPRKSISRVQYRDYRLSVCTSQSLWWGKLARIYCDLLLRMAEVGIDIREGITLFSFLDNLR